MEAGYQNPLKSHYISLLLKGVQLKLAVPPHQKLPITRDLVGCIPVHVVFWAAALTAFFVF